MDVVIYNRVSTKDKNQDPESNLRVSREFAKSNGYNIVGTILDKGISGDSFYYDRPNGKEIDAYIEKHAATMNNFGIVVFSIDRFTRQEPLKALSLLRDLRKEKHTYVFSATESMFNENGEFSLPMQFHIVWFNYYFLKQHSKKVKAGMDKRKADGLKIGRGIVKKIVNKGKKNQKKIYYTIQEQEYINDLIKQLSLKHTYRRLKLILEKKYGFEVSLGYISKIAGEKQK